MTLMYRARRGSVFPTRVGMNRRHIESVHQVEVFPTRVGMNRRAA